MGVKLYLTKREKEIADVRLAGYLLSSNLERSRNPRDWQDEKRREAIGRLSRDSWELVVFSFHADRFPFPAE